MTLREQIRAVTSDLVGPESEDEWKAVEDATDAILALLPAPALPEGWEDAALNAPLPEGYQWGRDAMEQFAFGKKQAVEAIRAMLAARPAAPSPDVTLQDAARAVLEASTQDADGRWVIQGDAEVLMAALLAALAPTDRPAAPSGWNHLAVERAAQAHYDVRSRRGYVTKPWNELSRPDREQLLVAMRAALSALAAPSEWRDIATAPSDGTPVWVFGGRHENPEVRSADGDYWRRNAGWEATPTHWQPYAIPAAPTEEER